MRLPSSKRSFSFSRDTEQPADNLSGLKLNLFLGETFYLTLKSAFLKIFYISFIYYGHVCVCVCVVGWRALVLSFHSVGPEDRILIIRPVSNCLCWLSHLAATGEDVWEDLSSTGRGKSASPSVWAHELTESTFLLIELGRCVWYWLGFSLRCLLCGCN